MAFEHEGILQYSADELKQLLAEGKVRVIDVRTPEEYADGHIPGVPLRPMQVVESWAHEIRPDDAVVFVCRSGRRSQTVAKWFWDRGFRQVANLYGGMLAWNGEVERGAAP
ncbi:sulfurtransferase [Alicyclobacillus cellulosilyticus]|uniref:Sulfurtransferase n=1 Tax=Alicyclobacillus cellulosilyticus TaxID=1003997 RepID=A0A917K1W7_9BACL|nr:rhodanese-like domain-containing protein [Alicyclobacillus cellulosilyticus]GGI95418.1 sulfurtransferase [Alicyclobacillus cellulosilyticus]